MAGERIGAPKTIGASGELDPFSHVDGGNTVIFAREAPETAQKRNSVAAQEVEIVGSYRLRLIDSAVLGILPGNRSC